ncbi:MAG: pyridoxal phosphate-dependent aminotransferase [Rhodospirillales bacterium]|nr:pyridoxal phosphate-dependent aminotransferase [Rhodospirillales bacterium]MBO6785877.1 pyridoxal phosphate-dependent aminotransferase [Rhodospirillales bacterium]
MSTIKIAQRMSRIEQSASSIASQKAREMKAAGRDVIALSAGEPDFPTPVHVVEAAFEAAKRGETRYTNAAGTPALKQAVVDKFKRENGLEYALDEVMVGSGGKQLLFDALVSTVEDGDEVIVPAPYWVSYIDHVKFAGGTPVIVLAEPENDFKLTPAQLDGAITPKTRWLILNSPSNPSGAVYTRDDLRGLADVLLKHPQVAVFADDIYEHIIFDDLEFATIAQVEPKLKDRTVTMNGASKVYSMTGWRIGYCGGPAPLLKEMTKLQQQITGSNSSVSQAAALAALSGPQDFVPKNCKSFQDRRDLVVSMLNQAKGVKCPVPKGAFYVFPDCSELIGKKTPDGKVIENDTDLVMYFLESHGVACVQGAAYGMSPFFRVSYAASEDELRDACERIQRACAELT